LKHAALASAPTARSVGESPAKPSKPQPPVAGQRGVARPGALEGAVTGISTRVLNERLGKRQRFGLIMRRAYAELPPRVAYRLTPFGRRFARLLDAVADRQADLSAG
jgi:DNA-binding HxlR family transcriptional regulator